MTFTVSTVWDEEALAWVGYCDEVPLAADSPTRDGLLARVWEIARDILPDNRPDIDLNTVHFELAD
jgi:hypothetical protein